MCATAFMNEGVWPMEKAMLDIENLDPKALGQRLADARKARGVTQEDAAKHIGCSRPTFHRH